MAVDRFDLTQGGEHEALARIIQDPRSKHFQKLNNVYNMCKNHFEKV